MLFVDAVLAVAVAVVVLRHLEHSWAHVVAFFATLALCLDTFFFAEGWREGGADVVDVLRALIVPLVIGVVLGGLASLHDRRLSRVVLGGTAVALVLAFVVGGFVVWFAPYDA